MTKIYLIRHAESIANTQGIFQGQTYNTGLSPLGLLQVEALKSRFEGTNFTKVFVSPLTRAVQTANGLNGPKIEDPELLETDHGDWSGKPKLQVQATWPDMYHQWVTAPEEVSFPHGEKFTDTADRAIGWFERLKSQDGIFAVVTHGNIIQILIVHVLGLPLNSVVKYPPHPTSVTQIDVQDTAKAVYINDISHLNGLQSDLGLQAI